METVCFTGRSSVLAENAPVAGKAISIAVTYPLAKDGVTRAGLRGE